MIKSKLKQNILCICLLGRISGLFECDICWWPWKRANGPFQLYWAGRKS